MPYRGHEKNGAVVLNEKLSLADGTEVRVEVVPDETAYARVV